MKFSGAEKTADEIDPWNIQIIECIWGLDLQGF